MFFCCFLKEVTVNSRVRATVSFVVWPRAVLVAPERWQRAQ
jgi:hypothetical protein